jgi:hypothetical protein
MQKLKPDLSVTTILLDQRQELSMEPERSHSLHQKIGKLQILVLKSHTRYFNLRRNIVKFY